MTSQYSPLPLRYALNQATWVPASIHPSIHPSNHPSLHSAESPGRAGGGAVAAAPATAEQVVGQHGDWRRPRVEPQQKITGC